MTLELIKSILLAVIQSITEIFPVSSSGHLVIIGTLLDIQPDQLYLTYLHFGTALALIMYYKESLLTFWHRKQEKAVRLLLIAYGSGMVIPVIIGMLYGEQIESLLYLPNVIVVSLTIWGVIMFIVGQKTKISSQSVFKKSGESKNATQSLPSNSSFSFANIVSKLGDKDKRFGIFFKLFLVGSVQALALIPGTSRSGITLLTALALGFGFTEAIDLALLYGIPMTFGPFIYRLLQLNSPIHEQLSAIQLITGLLTFPLGYLVIKLFQKYRTHNLLGYCGIYRIVAALVILMVSQIGD